jgi:PAS domain S-box-containing protein
MKVLVVDDAVAGRTMFRKFLTRFGYDVETCGNGEDALKLYEQEKFPIIITDVIMPIMDGYEFCRRIRDLNDGLQPVILAITAQRDPAVLERMLEAGADDFLDKPNLRDDSDIRIFNIRLQIAEKVAKDRLKRKHAEEAQRNSEEKYRSLVESLEEGIAKADSNGVLTFVNSAVCKILGYSKEELLGKNLREFIAPEDADKVDIYGSILRDGKFVRNELSVVRKDGERRVLIITVTPVIKHGKYEGALGILRDITTLKLNERKIQQQNEFLRNVIESLTYPFYVLDAEDYTIKLANSALGTDIPFGEVACHSMLYDKNDEFCFELSDDCPVNLVKKTKEPVTREHSFIDKQGAERYLEIHAYPIFDEDDEIKEVIEYRLDITDRKHVEKALRESNATKDKFFSIIAHDLRSPLTSLLSGNNLILEKIDRYDREEVKSIAEEMLISTENLFKLLEGLLTWSRLQLGKMRYRPRMLELYYIVEQNVRLLEGMAKIKEIELENLLTKDVVIYGDYDMVSAIFRNLLSNAIKFTEKHGNVRISAHNSSENFVEIRVEDAGIGMNPDEVAQLFRIDVDYHTPGTQGEEGAGLGLILCKEFVDKHNGEIAVESQPGKGTIFSVTLPKSE